MSLDEIGCWLLLFGCTICTAIIIYLPRSPAHGLAPFMSPLMRADRRYKDFMRAHMKRGYFGPCDDPECNECSKSSPDTGGNSR